MQIIAEQRIENGLLSITQKILNPLHRLYIKEILQILTKLLKNEGNAKGKLAFHFLMLTEIGGCLAEMLFYISAKEGRVGESELVADLLDAVVGLLQVVSDVL